MENIQFQKKYSALIQPGYPVAPEKNGSSRSDSVQKNSEFTELFRQSVEKNSKLVFSKHAVQRMQSRSIQVSPQLVSQLSGAVEQARAKGVKDALILKGHTAFIVNIPSSTVITTMNGGEMAENVFTNIDGAVIL